MMRNFEHYKARDKVGKEEIEEAEEILPQCLIP